MTNTEIILALVAAANAILLTLFQFYNSRKGARKDELAGLRDLVTELQGQVDVLTKERYKLNDEIILLKQENAWLVQVLMTHSIAVPPMTASFVRSNRV